MAKHIIYRGITTNDIANPNAPIEIYDMRGMRLDNDNLAPASIFVVKVIRAKK